MSPPVDAAAICAHYEALRREALGAPPDGAPSHGLALFLLRGTSAWYAALTALGPGQPDSRLRVERPDDRGPVAPSSKTRAALTTMLANMVLACLSVEGLAC